MLLLVFCDVNLMIYRHALNYVLLLSLSDQPYKDKIKTKIKLVFLNNKKIV